MILSSTYCQAELKKNGLIPRKYYGQVFTTDPAIIDRLIETIQSIYRPGTKIVEIGGGLGYITDPLIRNFEDVDCLEIDDDLFAILNKKFIQKNDASLNKNLVQSVDILSNKKSSQSDFLAKNKDKVEFVNKKNDHTVSSNESKIANRKSGMNNKIIQRNGLRLIKADILEYEPPKVDYLLVGNIPFHLSGKLYRKFMSDLKHKPYGMVFITDKQYATTLMGQPPRCYRVSLQAQAYGNIEIVADVPPSSVYPPPKVTSCIMKITHNPKPIPNNFWDTVNYHFDNFPTPEVISPKTLSLQDWIDLARKTTKI